MVSPQMNKGNQGILRALARAQSLVTRIIFVDRPPLIQDPVFRFLPATQRFDPNRFTQKQRGLFRDEFAHIHRIKGPARRLKFGILLATHRDVDIHGLTHHEMVPCETFLFRIFQGLDGAIPPKASLETIPGRRDGRIDLRPRKLEMLDQAIKGDNG